MGVLIMKRRGPKVRFWNKGANRGYGWILAIMNKLLRTERMNIHIGDNSCTYTYQD